MASGAGGLRLGRRVPLAQILGLQACLLTAITSVLHIEVCQLSVLCLLVLEWTQFSPRRPHWTLYIFLSQVLIILLFTRMLPLNL